ncbi:BnaC07g16560D [Brassica napus]|uniref:U1 small nuclear ribonucleoprotein 70 kDa n=1 Tax=Brassica napus TaxID=3708 RepID=A0A078GZ31_BRANA|nr:BnaC07g16560D [Brassica napus]
MGDLNDPFMRNQNAAVQARTKVQNRSNVLQLKLVRHANNMITSEFRIPNETGPVSLYIQKMHPDGPSRCLIQMLHLGVFRFFISSMHPDESAPLEFQPPPEQRKCPPYTGMAQYSMLHLSRMLKLLHRKGREFINHDWRKVEKAAEDLKNYDPNNDPNASGDPYKTLFVARLNYETSDSKIKREFEAYGPIKQVRLYLNTRNIKAAYKQGDGKKIDGRRVPVDVERGRTVPNWRPRRLGSGLGTTRVPGEKITGEEEQKQQQPSQGRSSRSEEPRAREDREKSRDRGKEREREQSRERSHERSRDRPRESHREDKHHRDRGRERESRRAEEIETVVHGITIVTGVGKGKGSTRAASMTTMVGDLVREKRSMRGEVTQTVMISRATVTDMMIVSTSGQSVLSRMSMVLMADAIVFP